MSNESNGNVDPSSYVQHDAVDDLKDQQEALNLAIHQHADDPDIVASLRAQKNALGAESNRVAQEQKDVAEHHDGGGVYLENIHHSGSISDVIGDKAQI